MIFNLCKTWVGSGSTCRSAPQWKVRPGSAIHNIGKWRGRGLDIPLYTYCISFPDALPYVGARDRKTVWERHLIKAPRKIAISCAREKNVSQFVDTVT
jgi:hypothetical protein